MAAGSSTVAEKNRELNVRTTSYEFFGPVGAAVLVPLLIVTTLGLFPLCTKESCSPLVLVTDPQSVLDNIAALKWWDWKAAGVYMLWISFHFVGYLVVPGRIIEGTMLRNNSRLKYKINGLTMAYLTAALLGGALYFYGLAPFVWIAENTLPLCTAATAYALAQATFLYLYSFRSNTPLMSLVGNSGNFIYDFWMGRELNPRLGFLDLKYLCELRPGLILWAILNLSYAAKQYHELGRVTNSMILVQIFEIYYVLDALINEEAILTTMDIIQDGFGFMLTYGDLVWVPFVYTLQARYLTLYPIDLSPAALGGILLVKIIGFYIFRSSNLQKNDFRAKPDAPHVKNLKFIQTASGTRLLVDGWWKWSRHMNYLGDWIMGIAWCLPCGFGHAIPYFYALYFALLLVHRSLRDEEKCQHKYGKYWDEYRQKVPYYIVPYIY
ncbi:ergosterol biosynthesis ERG4/ERG24 [Polychytrium aggregatum]|uniref:ergosterol biosynthesis ERG4/ERG24 n=1 Tax=Polychytrium aggregatum TaxID=110093 RepID=UPI0022FDE631|nr:ergosterol biosynthesis ERG4/ERG24 [Polychytrium aggregatum]KAI9209915.1 ergosterol biosynthesis ERG4/ERG24 [Polychytrium aggregatum]